ncbi:MAG: DUF58 domain-containing protein [Verrucomicrobiales bacterium]|nr:DUF58 domain-containing protein [Verrucomicrobiales bacterium]
MTNLEELIKKSKKIELRAKGVIDDNLNGEYSTNFRGRGIDFHDLREYIHGDEVRSIDWNTTARTGEPYVKQFVEQRELNIYIAIDVSRSSNYGSILQSRHDLAALIFSIIALSASKNGDKIGLILYTNKIEHFTEPKKGKGHAMSLLREVLSHEIISNVSSPGKVLRFILGRQKRRSMIFLISDFLCPSFKQELKICSFKHDLIALQTLDPAELEFPSIGKVYLKNPEDNNSYLINTSNKTIRDTYLLKRNNWQRNLEADFKINNVDHVKFVNDENCDPSIALRTFFKNRLKSRRH